MNISRPFVLLTPSAGTCARQRTHFLLLRQKKVSKEKATPLSVSPTLRSGATCGARSRGVPRNSLRACSAAFGQTRQVRSRGGCVLRRIRSPRLLRASARPEGLGYGYGCGDGYQFALCRRSGLVHGHSPIPSAAPASVCLRGEHARRSAHALLTDSPRLSERSAPARSELCGAPCKRDGAGLPRSEAQGSQAWGRISFGYFSLAKQRKVPRPPGRDPADGAGKTNDFEIFIAAGPHPNPPPKGEGANTGRGER